MGSIAAAIGAWAGLAACSPASPKLVEKPMGKFEKVSDKGDTKLIFTPMVDILFVVDDSGSMLPHQLNLSKNIDLYTSELQNNRVLDYRVGVITTSMDFWSPSPGGQGKLVGPPTVIDRNTPDGIEKLAKNIMVGTNGSGIEQFFEPVRLALTPPLIKNES